LARDLYDRGSLTQGGNDWGFISLGNAGIVNANLRLVAICKPLNGHNDSL